YNSVNLIRSSVLTQRRCATKPNQFTGSGAPHDILRSVFKRRQPSPPKKLLATDPLLSASSAAATPASAVRTTRRQTIFLVRSMYKHLQEYACFRHAWILACAAII